MNCLIDTNVLTRSAEPGHPQFSLATNSVATLRKQGFLLWLVPQVIYEFWSVCTRPIVNNGLGKSAAEAAAEITKLKGLFLVVPDSPAIYSEWERLVTSLQVLGKNAHDARLVASMNVSGFSHLLTFNEQDFRRFTGITVLTPSAVLHSAASSP